jgi:hypothetical protein
MLLSKLTANEKGFVLAGLSSSVCPQLLLLFVKMLKIYSLAK